MINKSRLEQKAAGYGLALTGSQLDLLARYAVCLVEYNQKVNLTAITDPEGVEDKHFIDSLLFAAQPEVAGRMVDVGCGAGFPGVVTKIYRPDLALTLMEPTGKRVEFLRWVCGQLGLSGVEFAKERAEEAARKQWREAFDLAPGAGGGLLHCHEGRLGRRRAGSRPPRHSKTRRRIPGDPRLSAARGRRAQPCGMQKDFANFDRLSPQRRKNRQVAPEMTGHKAKIGNCLSMENTGK